MQTNASNEIVVNTTSPRLRDEKGRFKAIPQTPAEFADQVMGFAKPDPGVVNTFIEHEVSCAPSREVFGEEFGPGYAGYNNDAYEFNGGEDDELHPSLIKPEYTFKEARILFYKTHIKVVLDKGETVQCSELRQALLHVQFYTAKRVVLVAPNADSLLKCKDLVSKMRTRFVENNLSWQYVNFKIAA